jgi:putative hydrolase
MTGPAVPAEDYPAEDYPAEDYPVEDHHVHSTFSDDATSSVAENLAAAQTRGLRTVCLADHVRAGTPWLPEFVHTVRTARLPAAAPPGGPDGGGLRVLCGVEAKLLDPAGRLDLPDRLPPLDRVLIADHQYPDTGGPLPPAEVRHRLDQGRLTVPQVVETLLLATVRALRRTPHPQLAHLFSLLPKVGIDEDAVGPDQLRLLASAARQTGAVVEVNEKWGCPGPVAIAAFRAAGVPVVTSTDSHRAVDVGVFRRVPALLRLSAGMPEGGGR